MALSVKWLYPPNWDGNPPDKGGWNRVKVQLIADGSTADESYAKKVDISELRTASGQAPTRTVVEEISYSSAGMTALKLFWDRNPREPIANLYGATDGNIRLDKVDPGEAGDGTGDILLSTAGVTTGYYTIVLTLGLKD
jgi:hypothetical protein